MSKADNSEGPIQEKYVQQMNALCSAIDELFNGNDRSIPRKVGFGIVMFDFNPEDRRQDRMNWISNSDRKDMLCALKELVARWEGRALQTPAVEQ